MSATPARRIAAAALILAALTQSAAAAGAPVLPGSDRMFNPQPEPPERPSFTPQGSIFNDLSIHSFNPQPEPPPALKIKGLSPLQR